jgi:hypothetical protein
VCVKSRKRSNSIIALKKGREWLSKPIEIRAEVVDYFRKHFDEVRWERPRLDGVEFKQLSSGDIGGLEDAIELSDGNKSTEPDGFNFTFFKKFWNACNVIIEEKKCGNYSWMFELCYRP